ncbi:MAG TPA: M20/M25/M40 family metallo-hydrolase [Chryseosolibacter sp.]|nr:M20/M25/M40 family metallo-hydrolase [Chryseosolibacter sp.]
MNSLPYLSALKDMRKVFLFVTLVSLSSCITQGQELDRKAILRHIRTLANDSLAGRGTGTAGERSAAAYIEREFAQLYLIPKGDASYLQGFPFAKGAHGAGATGMANNVIGFLDNGGKTTIVIGAHYDHLGTDGQGSSLDANPTNKIHNGADDNASGVAGVLELARYFATNQIRENSNFIFVCFSGEELGLLGSKYFTEHPPVDLASVDYMINLDMIGRLNTQTRQLLIHGTGTSPVWEPLLKNIEKDGLSITTDSSGVGPSDHTSFYLKNIPVLHFFTGSHEDYHKPGDDIDKINADGELRVLKLIIRIIESLNNEPKLAFLPTRNKMQSRQTAFKVTLGIMPSYASSGEGLKVDGVSDGKPAAMAGIKTGDVIIQMGEFPIDDIYKYMEALGKFEKGQSVPVKIKRGTEVLELSVTF